MVTQMVPYWSATASFTAATPSALYLPKGWGTLRVDVTDPVYLQTGPSYAAPAVTAVNGITTVTLVGGATGGTFTIRVFPGTELAVATASLAYNATAANIKTALVNTGLFASGDITAAGGAMDSAAVTLTWTGVYASTIPPIELGANALTGGTNPSVLIRPTTQASGNGGYGYAETGDVLVAHGGGSRQDRFLYIAGQVGDGTVYLTAYR